jgi:O-succinylbenzoic acid--CoA ligase
MLLFSPSSNSFPLAESDFQREVYDFCQKWNAGQSEFTFSTSGSTGVPKSLVISREKMIYSANLTANWLNLKANDVALLCLPIQYIAGAMVLVRALVLDLKVILIDPKADLIESLKKKSIAVDLASFLPNQWMKLMADVPLLNKCFFQCKGVLLGGGPLDIVLEKMTYACDFPVFHTYGMTETVSHIAFREISPNSEEPNYHVLPNIFIQKNDQGCLRIKSFLTDNKWIETNDLVNLINEESFQILGRTDFVINSAGFKIFPQKVENLCQDFFHSLDLDVQLFVFGIHDKIYGQKAILISNNAQANDHFDALLEFLLTKLDRKELPKSILFIPTFQLTPNGKIDQIKTVNLYFNQQQNGHK